MSETKRRTTWGDVFRRNLAKGMDHADAAFRADEWEKRRRRKPAGR